MAVTGISAVTVVDRVTLSVTFSTDGSGDSVTDVATIANWELTPSEVNEGESEAATCMPYSVVVTLSGGGATLVMHPEYTPNAEYSLKYKTYTKTFTPPATLVPAAGEGEFPKGLLECITMAVGQQLQQLGGRPETVLLKDFSPATETVIFTETTYGFLDAGQIWIGDLLFSYNGTYWGGFKNVVIAEPVDADKRPTLAYHEVQTGDAGSKVTSHHLRKTAPFIGTIQTTTIIVSHVQQVPPSDSEGL